VSVDPYGYPDAATPRDAAGALWIAVAAIICTSVGLCACYLPYLAGAPLGVWAAIRANAALAGATDPRDRTMATASLVMGIVSAVVSGLISLFILAYVAFFALYMLIVVVAVGVGAATGAGEGGDTGAVFEMPAEAPPP
jgi:hypothetical protein